MTNQDARALLPAHGPACHHAYDSAPAQNSAQSASSLSRPMSRSGAMSRTCAQVRRSSKLALLGGTTSGSPLAAGASPSNSTSPPRSDAKAVRRRGRCGEQSAVRCLRWGGARPRRPRSGLRSIQDPPTSLPTATALPLAAGWGEGRPGRRRGCPDGGWPPLARGRSPARSLGTPHDGALAGSSRSLKSGKPNAFTNSTAVQSLIRPNRARSNVRPAVAASGIMTTARSVPSCPAGSAHQLSACTSISVSCPTSSRTRTTEAPATTCAAVSTRPGAIRYPDPREPSWPGPRSTAIWATRQGSTITCHLSH